MKYIYFLWTLLFLATNSFAKTPDNLDSNDFVKLEYGWHPGISAAVKLKHIEKVSKSDGSNNAFTINGNYLIRTKEHTNGIQIDFESIYFTFDKTGSAEADNKLQQFMQKLISINPSYVINHEGELHEVTKFDEFSQAIKEEMSSFFTNTPEEELAQIKQLVDSIYSEEQIMSQLQDDWNRDVGQWIGGELEQGYSYDVKFNRPVPMLGNIEIPNIGRYAFLERIACNKKEQKKKCVRLSYYSHVNEEATKPMLQELFKKAGIENTEDIGFKLNYALEVITEEKTLLPHYIKETKTISMPNPKQGGFFEKEEIEEYEYTYINR